jgi:tetratricopeptide (TPR) repeat protein
VTDPTDALPLDTERLLTDSVAQALEHEDARRFLRWFSANLPGYFTAPQQDLFRDPDDIDSMAAVMGRAIWNAMPLPGNGLQPRPLPEPGRNDPCICGSGRKYKRCCAGISKPPPLDSGLLVSLVMKQAPKDVLQNALRTGRAPVDAIISLAVAHADEGKPKKAAETLEPLFPAEIRKHDERLEYAMDLLCDQYDSLGYHKKKSALLDHIIDVAPRSPLRSGAWQRLATIRMDGGDAAGAWEAFRRAQQDSPDAPSLSLLEVQLLLSENRVEEASRRAAFWERRLRARGVEDERILRFLGEMAEDPSGTMANMGMEASGGAGRPLAEWLDEVAGRSLPAFEVEDADAPLATGDMEAALRDRLRAMGVRAGELDKAVNMLSEQLADHYDEPVEAATAVPDAGAELAPPESLRLEPPPDVAAVEALWREVCPVDKPFSVQPDPFDDEGPWDPDDEAEWMTFLAAHPEAFDSLDILDDLATMVRRHPFAGHWVDATLLEPVLRRAEAIVRHALRVQNEPRLAWQYMENRPALRCLVRLCYLHLDRRQEDEAEELANRILGLNPDDNHGLRGIVADRRLRRGDDEGVLALTARYPDDPHPETAFGRVLALYRLGRLNEAQQALCEAMTHMQSVVHALTAKRMARPKLTPGGVTLGGDDQAWLYREEMRDVWQQTPGALDWLKQAAKRCPRAV